MIGFLAAIEAVATSNDSLRAVIGSAITPPSADDHVMPTYSQTDPAWANDAIGTTTIGRFGCLITCWAMILSQVEGRDVPPNEVVSRLDKAGRLQSNGGVLYVDLPKLTPVPLLTWERVGGDGAELFGRADAVDCVTSFGVVGVRIGEWPGTHYVLTIGDGWIINPIGGKRERFDDKYKSGGIFSAAVWSLA